jgi:lipopolysaccharide export system permease protein
MRNLFLGLDLSGLDAALLFFYMVPMFMLIVVPFSCMLSVFLTFLRMSTDRELVALRAGGVNLYQLLPAPLIFCTLCAIMNLAVSLYGVSWGMYNFRSTVMDIANNRARIVVQPGVFNQDIFGLTLFARQVDPDTQEMHNVIFEDRTQDKKNRLTILAESGTIKAEPQTGSILFALKDGHIYRADGEQFGILAFKDYEIRLDLSKVFSGIELGEVRPKEMSWQELKDADAERNGPSERFQLKVVVEVQKRWALPAACVILGLFAMPLACMFEGVRRQMGVILSLVMFLVYYSLFSLGLSIAESGKISPVTGLWVPNVFFTVAGSLGLFLTVRESVPTFRSVLLQVPFLRKRAEAAQGGDV